MQQKTQKICQLLLAFAAYAVAMVTFAASPAMPTDTSREIMDATSIAVDIVESPDIDAQFTDGEDALCSFLARNICYPVTCAQNAIQGNVEVSFIVRPDGFIADVKVVKGVHPQIDAEAVRVVRNLPKYIPATNKGVPVAVKKSLTITFKIK